MDKVNKRLNDGRPSHGRRPVMVDCCGGVEDEIKVFYLVEGGKFEFLHF